MITLIMPGLYLMPYDANGSPNDLMVLVNTFGGDGGAQHILIMYK